MVCGCGCGCGCGCVGVCVCTCPVYDLLRVAIHSRVLTDEDL